MEAGHSENFQIKEVRRIERETKVRVPSFVSRWPAIDREKAADLALANDLVDKQWLVYRHGGLDNEHVRWFAARAGVLFCRNHDVNVEGALRNVTSWERARPSSLELFERFLHPRWNKIQLTASEVRRRKERDMDILHLEIDLLRLRGFEIPELPNLVDYCQWLLDSTGINEKYKRWGWTHRQDPQMVYWDLMGHYSQIIKGARSAFNPLTDFELYLKGRKDIQGWEDWNLQNMGKDDITYYSMSVAWGGGARTKSSEIKYPERLVTHTTSLNAARSFAESSYLDPRVCLSTGRVVSVRSYPEVTFIFDRVDLAKVYSIRQYGETEHEKEVRCQELVNIGFAIGCVPMSRTLFPDYHGGSQGTQSFGDATIQKWEERYLKTGLLLDAGEIEMIRLIASNHGA